jgi:3-oxoadipate enol-lactonase
MSRTASSATTPRCVNLVDKDVDRAMVRPMSAATDVERNGFAWRQAGSGPPILLLHGLGGSRISWEPQLVGLSGRFSVAAWDLPGYGRAAPLAPDGRLTFGALADAVVGWADVLGVDRFHVVGISFGGMIAQYVMSRAPGRVISASLLATSPKFGLDGTDPQQWRSARLARLDLGDEPSAFAHDVISSLAGPDLAEPDLLGQVAAMERIGGVALRGAIDCLVTHDSRALLASVSIPTLVLVGSEDHETPVEYSRSLSDAIPGARLSVIEGAGHLLNVEAPAEINRLIIEHADHTEHTEHTEPTEHAGRSDRSGP